ncbi:hypothetical protein NKR23_g3807 [Pleurostoma richardsiae]|uniref:SWR1-complex protein 3 domain-containing protein n=1 Tax=Pleurostoma richardsiae TaxID=41990 RepID=A0AA38RYP2_9PEZI|nr:hypothetical protein NKR23_g3807 [Pleurostoma richardsiae]
MEKKRKLPARAAARVEHVSKKRTATPDDNHSATPSSAPTPTPDEPPLPYQNLPRSVQPGWPLPTVEHAQPDDLPSREYQSIQESGVLHESVSRSRQRWITEGIFEKYWTKPSKRKGVVIEEPNNPPKDSMTKLGQVTITVEPHVFEATMFAVKDPKPPPPTPVFRPIIQYGPPNGTMPPPPPPPPPTPPSNSAAPAVSSPSATASTAAPAPTPLQPQTQTPTAAPSQPHPPPPQAAVPVPPATASPAPPVPLPSPRGMESVLSPGSMTPQPAPRPPSLPPSYPPQPSHPMPSQSPAPAGPGQPPPLVSRSPAPQRIVPTTPTVNATMSTPPPRPAQPAGTDPIIVTLAEKATEDPQLRDLMKRVAGGNAPKDELERFQAIIDQITLESKRKGALQGPSADRLLVDGRTVRYFADEVRAILDIVFATNPRQTSADLRPPPGSDPLVVLLVKAALDDTKIRDMVRRIAENRPLFSDATDLKAALDRLKNRVARERELQRLQPPSAVPANGPSKPNGLVNGQLATASTNQAAQPPQPQPQQALRSKGPPPPAKPDISAIVFEFSGGNGDRYLFPKFSILEYVQSQSGPQVIASFLIVRKGSTSEYGGDPTLDYYQPVTVRLWSPTGKHLENLVRVVAPPDEVRRYMNHVMDTMTRAEYVLLAMRLPKVDKDAKDDSQPAEKEKEDDTNGTSTETEEYNAWQRRLLWKTDKAVNKVPTRLPSLKDGGKHASSEDEQYQSFVASVSRREPEEV